MPELRYLKSYHQKLYYPCSIHPHLQITVSAGYLSSGSILTPASSLYRMIYLRLSLSGFTLYCPHIRVGCGSETLLGVVELHRPQKTNN